VVAIVRGEGGEGGGGNEEGDKVTSVQTIDLVEGGAFQNPEGLLPHYDHKIIISTPFGTPSESEINGDFFWVSLHGYSWQWAAAPIRMTPKPALRLLFRIEFIRC